MIEIPAFAFQGEPTFYQAKTGREMAKPYTDYVMIYNMPSYPTGAIFYTEPDKDGNQLWFAEGNVPAKPWAFV